MERQDFKSKAVSSKVHPTLRALLIAGLGLVFAVLPALFGPRFEVFFWLFWISFSLLLGYDALLSTQIPFVEVSLPKQLFIGEEAQATLVLKDLREVTAKLDTQAPIVSREASSVPTEAGALLQIPLTAERRGPGEITALWLRWASSLGLFYRSACFTLQAPLPVLLNLPKVQKQALHFISGRTTLSGPQIEKFYGDGSEFDSLREFVSGLDPRMIDWRSSARHNKLLFRQCRAERDRQLLIAVDTGHLMAEPLNGAPRLDHALHAAMLLSYIGARAGDRVGFFAFDEVPRAYVVPTAGSRSISPILQKASELTYQATETNFTVCLAELCSRLTRRTLIVVLTEFIDTTTAELMIENIQRTAKRHLVLFVALRDPVLQKEASAPTDAISLHRAVLMASLQKERELVLLRLRRLGVLCIDALPEEVGPALVNRYLDVKRREML
jgi:uncharacterized protein (DUF58 family)